MKILLTGASSFTGMWFAEALAAAGHDVVAPLRSELSDYQGLRAERVGRVGKIAEIVPGVVFGSDSFLDLARGRDFDVLAHHAAGVTGYRSLQFDVARALVENTTNFPMVLEVMARRGLKAVIATGSVFENDEGGGDEPLEAFSPYGLSKSMTYQAIRFWTRRAGVPLGKFIISNPFGPYEEPRFCNYLLKCWTRGETATVSTPSYVRDNIHVDLLSLVYSQFVAKIASDGQFGKIGPSGYIEHQGDFAKRFASKMRKGLGLACDLAFVDQVEFPEPRARYNTTSVDTQAFGWSESTAWLRLQNYYRSSFALYG